MVSIGNITINGIAALAPMAGVSDAAMRLLCHEQGSAWSVSEMLSAKGWVYSQGRNRNANQLLRRFPNEGITALQLFGSEPEIMAEATELLDEAGYEFFDLNFGCPAPKITGNGEGSALMLQPELIGRIVKAIVSHTKKPVTAKIRAGWDEAHINAVEVARICEQNGASAITVHGRTRKQQYSGQADWNIIREVKKALDIPVFGNGDVRCGTDAVRMIEETNCDAVLVGRAAEGNPWIFDEINAVLEGRSYSPPTPQERVEMVLRHFELETELYGDKGGMLEMRKHIAWYISGVHGAAKLREQVNGINDPKGARDLLKEYAKTLLWNEPTY